MSQRLFALSLIAAAIVAGAGCSSKKPPVSDDKAAAPGPVAPAAAAQDEAAYKRSSIGCERIAKGVAEAAPKDMKVEVSPGWSKLPPELQIIPPGGELCGSMSVAGGTPLVRSSLFGKALADFYQPVATAAGCTLEHEIIASGSYQRTQVEIRCDGALWALIGTDTGYEFYTLTIMTPRKAG